MILQAGSEGWSLVMRKPSSCGVIPFMVHKSGEDQLIWQIIHIPYDYGIFTHIYHKHQLNVGKYTSPMDPMDIFDHFWLGMAIYYLNWCRISCINSIGHLRNCHLIATLLLGHCHLSSVQNLCYIPSCWLIGILTIG